MALLDLMPQRHTKSYFRRVCNTDKKKYGHLLFNYCVWDSVWPRVSCDTVLLSGPRTVPGGLVKLRMCWTLMRVFRIGVDRY